MVWQLGPSPSNVTDLREIPVRARREAKRDDVRQVEMISGA
jgi:hypothetical protein